MPAAGGWAHTLASPAWSLCRGLGPWGAWCQGLGLGRDLPSVPPSALVQGEAPKGAAWGTQRAECAMA